MRLFVAVPLPREITDPIGRLLPELPALRAVRPEAMHITLAFLGEVPDARVSSAVTAVRDAGHARARFAISLDHLGRFPEHGAPRTVWVGVGSGAEELRALATSVRDALARAKLPFDAKPFQPHVTLGRVREGADHAGVRALDDAIASARITPQRFDVEGVLLLQSELSPKGPRYTPRATVPLGVVG